MDATTAAKTVQRSGAIMMVPLRTMIRTCAREIAGPDAPFATMEAITLAVANDIVRDALRGELQDSADSFGEAVRIAGKLYVEHESGRVAYHSLCGPLEVQRSTYRLTGVHNGSTVVPLELEAGLIERSTPALAKAVVLGYAKHDLRSSDEDLHTAHRDPPSRATMERIACAVAEHACDQAPRIEKQLRRKEELPEGAWGVVLGLDRGSVPMAEEREPGAPPATRRRKRDKPYERTPPDPFDVIWRMAPVATVAITDRSGDALVVRRYATTGEERWEGILGRAMQDVAAALRQNPKLQVGVVQDGARELWIQTRAAMSAEPAVTSYVEAVDRYHVSERLGKVLVLIEPDRGTRTETLARWERELDSFEGAIDWIEEAIRNAAAMTDTATGEALDDHMKFIHNNKDRMRYALLKSRGLPVGSGTTESACNTLLNLRVKRNAEHWSEPGLNGVLTVRAVHQSERFDSFWRVLAHDYTDHVMRTSRAA